MTKLVRFNGKLISTERADMLQSYIKDLPKDRDHEYVWVHESHPAFKGFSKHLTCLVDKVGYCDGWGLFAHPFTNIVHEVPALIKAKFDEVYY